MVERILTKIAKFQEVLELLCYRAADAGAHG